MKLTHLIALTVSLISYFEISQCLTATNDRPIIGVLAEETNSRYSVYGSSAITASYVKFLEFAGARVVPIMIYQPKEYYVDLLSKINGVLFPGGGDLLKGVGYGKSGKIIIELAMKMNDKGDYFPLWGTCLGFELLNYVIAEKSWMKACSAQDLATNINFMSDFDDSKMFSDIDELTKNMMQKEKVTINYHRWCFTLQNYTLSGLDKFFKVLAINQDAKNLTHVSIIEARNYPFYGVSFHPEKILFEWVVSKSHHNIPHTPAATKVSQYFANFFVNEARKNQHHFPSKAMEDKVLIYNYNPVFTGKLNSSTVQNYYFL